MHNKMRATSQSTGLLFMASLIEHSEISKTIMAKSSQNLAAVVIRYRVRWQKVAMPASVDKSMPKVVAKSSRGSNTRGIGCEKPYLPVRSRRRATCNANKF
ncbi:hypothetical protein LC20_08825 [Yersinia hibernica]|uniref:Uncharacterized protein n=1 Tax=Yersinia enterocolitica LC20 TaxID=1443113 RepID=A0A7U5PGY3_YEREN|nr:hypothetical protein LC20_08825 [Yersinia hibernica]OVZ80516.1 hypothetical protein CBW54_18550 [Yersinia kristensenii]